MRHYCAAEAAVLVIYVSQLFMRGFICSLIWIHWEIKHMRRFGSSIIPLQHLPLIVMFLWQGICNTPQNKESYYEPKLINTEDWTSSKIIYRNDLFCSVKLMQKESNTINLYQAKQKRSEFKAKVCNFHIIRVTK